jgi:DNA-binding response OmpR family regulator
MRLFPPKPGRGIICFIDDDPNELRRFEKAMKKFEYKCVTGTTYSDVERKLQDQKLDPDLWVLDLYFPSQGATNSEQQRAEMVERYAELERKTREFRAFLETVHQGAEGGINLLRRCQKDYKVPVVMFTRKGNLEDAIHCYEAGAAAVLKKSMPPTLEGDAATKIAQLDKAMEDDAGHLMTHFVDKIRLGTFWYKYEKWIMFAIGAAASGTIEFLWRHMFGIG